MYTKNGECVLKTEKKGNKEIGKTEENRERKK